MRRSLRPSPDCPGAPALQTRAVHRREPTSTGGGRQAPAGPAASQPLVLCVQQPNAADIRRLVLALRAPLRFCGSGGEALELARARPLSCIIAPLTMPDMTARTLIETLREVAPGLAVIVIVDNPAVSEAVTVMRSGAHAVVDSRILSSGLLLHLAPLLRSP